MSASATVDVAGGSMGGAARFRVELYRYLERTGRRDVNVIGADRRLDAVWLLRREVMPPIRVRRVALNNVGFVAPGGERWTLLGNALHFLNDSEISRLHTSLRPTVMRQAAVVRLAARRSDVLIAPCSAMAERVASTLPSVRGRLFVRMHPVSADLAPRQCRRQVILCPVIFEKYKYMAERLTEWVDAVQGKIDPRIRMLVTASPSELPVRLANNPRIELVGQLQHDELHRLWARCSAIFFPTGLESFGYPLAEARANGFPVIALETAQNREIAGKALCGFKVGDAETLRHATERALATDIAQDPEPFDPDAYFDWMLGSSR